MAMFNNYDRLPDGIHRLCEMFIEEPLNMIEYAYEGLEGSLPNPWSYPGPIAGRAIEQSKKKLGVDFRICQSSTHNWLVVTGT